MNARSIVEALIEGSKPELSQNKLRRIKSLQRKADSADIDPGSVDHRVMLNKIKRLKRGESEASFK